MAKRITKIWKGYSLLRNVDLSFKQLHNLGTVNLKDNIYE